MKTGRETDIIDKQFLKAVDYLKVQVEKEYKKGSKIEDTYFGKLIYPSNRYFIPQVRNGNKNTPHVALITLARMYDIDFNYFYNHEAEPEDMFLTDQNDTRVSKELKKEQIIQLDQALEDFDSKVRLATAVLEGCKETVVKEVLQTTTPMVEACKKLLTQNKQRLTQEGIRSVIDQAVHLIRTKMELFIQCIDSKEQLVQLTTVKGTSENRVLKLEKELSDCYRDVKEYGRVALEAQKAEAAALRQLLAK